MPGNVELRFKDFILQAPIPNKDVYDFTKAADCIVVLLEGVLGKLEEVSEIKSLDEMT